MRPLKILLELENADEIHFKIDVLAVQKNSVLMSSLSTVDVERVKEYAKLVMEDPSTEK